MAAHVFPGAGVLLTAAALSGKQLPLGSSNTQATHALCWSAPHRAQHNVGVLFATPASKPSAGVLLVGAAEGVGASH